MVLPTTRNVTLELAAKQLQVSESEVAKETASGRVAMLEHAVFLGQISKKYRKDLGEVSSIFAKWQKEASQRIGGELVDLQEQTERSKRYDQAMQDELALTYRTRANMGLRPRNRLKTTMLSRRRCCPSFR